MHSISTRFWGSLHGLRQAGEPGCSLVERRRHTAQPLLRYLQKRQKKIGKFTLCCLGAFLIMSTFFLAGAFLIVLALGMEE